MKFKTNNNLLKGLQTAFIKDDIDSYNELIEKVELKFKYYEKEIENYKEILKGLKAK